MMAMQSATPEPTTTDWATLDSEKSPCETCSTASTFSKASTSSTASTCSTASGMIVMDSESNLSSANASKRSQRRQQQDQALQRFLSKHSFEGLHVPRLSESPSEMVYPIHVAAQQGDCNLLRTMLALGASLDQQTSRGRTAYDFAFEANRDGSHLDTLGLLRTRVQVFNTMKDFLRAKISKSKVRRVESAAVSL
ncbi:unnamed protein product [Effrenium voratum]|uniref:ANK_REP_REGION domain-containing protein n=1 Tax=Effrenium voratum TaxID=2562239 RepID=A0AA36MVE1_9DINO|nr:unnamed protein product [Effrenium voratum]CAJ1433938.1 unnamed protein product [Effrenium voratum]